jgi:hypothetical protein
LIEKVGPSNLRRFDLLGLALDEVVREGAASRSFFGTLSSMEKRASTSSFTEIPVNCMRHLFGNVFNKT